jgi:hypothetical protein
MQGAKFDRTKEDLGNIVVFEHVNAHVADQRLAIVFYVEGLGLTRDPYMNATDDNMWINAGRNQFHLPTRQRPQVYRGRIGLVVPKPDVVRKGLERVKPKLAGTKFEWKDEGDLFVTCPWGNQLRIHEASSAFGGMKLGIPYVEFPVAKGAADGIARFYAAALNAPAKVDVSNGARAAVVNVGVGQQLIFRETADAIAPYDGHHLAIYVADHSGPHRWLLERGLVTQESDQWQYRFDAIVDPDSRKELFRLEHEVRSLSHPMFTRQWSLVNRNSEQVQENYRVGRDAYYAS